MKRIVIMVLRNIIFIPWMLISLYKHSKDVDNYTLEEHTKMMKFIINRANKGGNVTIEAHGIENLPKEDGYVLFPNHQGMYDMLAMIHICPTLVSPVAKKELQKVKILDWVVTVMRGYFLDRDDIRDGLRIINAVTQDVKNGRNFLIFPEGTRSKNGNKLGEFKGGSFKSATKAKCPIIPVAFIDSFLPFDANSIKPVTVQVHILEPMYYEEYKGMKTTEIAKIVKERIEKVIRENEKLVDKQVNV